MRLAPGLADDPQPFLTSKKPRPQHVKRERPHALLRARMHLDALTATERPELVLIEGAGGLHVPMPGGSWQSEWIRELADQVIIATTANLGTINHTLLTIDGLHHAKLPIAGFVVVQRQSDRDPLTDQNIAVISQASGVACLGELPYLPSPARDMPTNSTWLTPAFWRAIKLGPQL